MKEVVIKISDAMYKYITMEHTICIKEVGEYLFGLVRCTGTLLPKGHGRLIDADAFIEIMKDASKRQKYKEVLISDHLTIDDVFKAVIESLQNEGLANGDTPTIIEADKEYIENVRMVNALAEENLHLRALLKEQLNNEEGKH